MASTPELLHLSTIDVLSAQPFVQLIMSGNQSIVSGFGSSPISWTTPITDPFSFWSSGSPTKLTPSISGFYYGQAAVHFAANSTGSRIVNIVKNADNGGPGTMAQATHSPQSTTLYNTIINLSGLSFFNGTTDYVEVWPFQNSGANLNVLGGVSFTSFSLLRVHV